MQRPVSRARSWVEVSPRALLSNVEALRARAGDSSGMMAVVKANAYGHGVDIVVPALAPAVQSFAVANLTEAVEVRSLAPEHPILILGTALPEERGEIAARGFVPVVSDLEEARGYAAHGKVAPVPVHLAVDSGMGRIGVWEEEALELARMLQRLPGIRLCGIGSHFPVSDEDDAFTFAQTRRFVDLAVRLRSEGLVEGPVHIANSAGAIGFPEACCDLFRPGLALYGCSPRPEFQGRLRPVLAWKSRVSLVRNFGPGRGVSYGRTFITRGDTLVATVAVGYADGFRRDLSHRDAHVLVQGRRCPVLGRVTMDQILVDVSACAGVEAGAEVVLIGAQGQECITVSEFASKAETIPWEVFTGIGPRVERVRVDS